MKSIVGGVLEYRNADGRLQHIHEPDVTSSLKENEKGPLDCLVQFFSFWKINTKIDRDMHGT